MAMLILRTLRGLVPALFLFSLGLILYRTYGVGYPATETVNNHSPSFIDSIPDILKPGEEPKKTLKYKPTPIWLPPPITDPFPLLATSTADPPPVPKYNVARPKMHEEYGLDRPPPLYIGFTRQWPMLLQAVVSYITAGWPADNIYVVENTGVHNKNKEGKLSLQNPFYLNHTTLHRLGINVVQTPVLLSFAQMQNFFLNLAYENDHPYYFYSHQDVLVFSFEEGFDLGGRPGDRDWEWYDETEKQEVSFAPQAGQPGYRTIYANCLRDLNTAVKRKERWGFRFYQFDHLCLVNREAMESIGGWDTMIPYYSTDCDIMAKMKVDGWTMRHRRVGIINDVSAVMDDLESLYRTRRVEPSFTDPAPLPPEEEERIAKAKAEEEAKKKAEKKAARAVPSDGEMMPSDLIEYFRILREVGDDMGRYKYRDGAEQRNNWQKSQRGGQGEPFYYDAEGFNKGFWALADAGRRVYTEKWGHDFCGVPSDSSLRLSDQWRVEPESKE
ncbi:hypothetical protein QBC38DRAFT_490556 [Podospora fimiseda]|uniref:Uncharacterized protein n=1 Tax=Podospora fimiseda TaxID=252190 RepID=A0AAN7BFF7_9PEZI|nr:hypothetical protein QBC38DRAFT_490556 [Podospora fimiseda]